MTHKKLVKALKDPASATYLDLSVKSADDLDGIEALTALEHLHLNLKVDVLPEAVFGLETLQGLHIKGKALSALPPSIGKLVGLRSLDVSSNKLTELPAELAQLTELRELSATHNAILELPDLSACVSLNVLRLRKNRLTSIPRSLKALPITQLSLGGNRILPLPEDFAEWTSLESLELDDNPKLDLTHFAALPNLRSLSLANCKLKSLPPALFDCGALEWLTVAKNPLGALPGEIGNLTNLRALYVWECKLGSVPQEIGRLDKLTLLEIERNELAALPEAIGQLQCLKELHIEKNRFTEIPEAVFALSSLTRLIAHDNDIRVIGDGLTRLGALEYLRLEDNPVERFPEDLGPLAALKTFYVGLSISVEEVQSQVQTLPPRAFIMSHGVGDIARDGRWSNEPAPAASEGAGELHVFHHEGRPTDAVFVDGGIASVGYDGLRVFDRASGKERFAIPNESALAVAPGGGELLLADGRGELRLVHASSGDTLRTYDFPGPVGRIGFTHDGGSIFVIGVPGITFLDRESGAEQSRIDAQRVSFASLSPDDETVAFGVKRAVHLVDRATGKEKARVVIDKRQVGNAVFGPEGDFVVASGIEAALVLFDPAKKKPKKQVLPTEQLLYAMDLSPDGTSIATTEWDHAVRLRDRKTGGLLHTFEGHAAEGPLDSVRFSPDGTELVSVGCDKTVRVWKV